MKGYRFMRMLIFFDLPVQTSKDRKEYRRFRNYLITNGFLMMQESVYVKLALNYSIVKRMQANLEKNKPKKGLVQLLVITEKQYAKMDTLVGEVESDVVDTDDRLLIL